MGGSKEYRTRLFSMVSSNGTIGNGHKLKHEKFHLNIRNTGTGCPERLWSLHP